jgi:hypothetical protein
MKKTLLACLAVAALLAIASPAFAITCTVDQRPAATLLVPYFQVSVDSSGNVVNGGATALDTIVTIANASAAPMIAHVSLFDQYSELVLDFNIALTGFDVQAMRMSDVISGTLPVTPNSLGHDPCQAGDAIVYSGPVNAGGSPDGFLRVVPASDQRAATTQDNHQATTVYSVPAFGPGLGVIDSLSQDCNGVRGPNAIGYITIDHANYCNLSNPQLENYYTQDAIGMENNLWGEIIFTSGSGIPTYAMSTVNLEADDEFGNVALANIDGAPVRSFYARYWNGLSGGDNGGLTNGGDFNPGPGRNLCPNCSGNNGIPCPSDNSLDCNAIWDVGYGDQREPLGLKWASRWFDAGVAVTTNFRAWRGSVIAQGRNDFCTLGLTEPISTETFWDEDERTVTTGKCPSPCTNPSFNFPLETQQLNIGLFSHPGATAGWVQVDFGGGNVFDQAWLDYSFEGAIALETILVPGTQLDPSTCNPLAWQPPATAVVIPEISTIPTGTGQ